MNMEATVFTREGQYVSPGLEILDVESEGVLCQSGGTEDYNEKDFIM